ncbi:MAG: hydroxylamine reductase [Bacteriovoracaceae bacterium]|nr:hydroxylamine reductase [Bacteriovoracaceae bacterium]
MFCYQCQEALNNTGCTVSGACGKTTETANLQDLLLFVNKGISILAMEQSKTTPFPRDIGQFITRSLFSTITNANFDDERFNILIDEALYIRNNLKEKYGSKVDSDHPSLTWLPKSRDEYLEQATQVGIMTTENEDMRSLRELLTYGIKGIAAYAHHAQILGYESLNVYNFLAEGLAATTKNLSVDDMVAMNLKAGEIAVETMALLDKANTETYGNPEISKVNIGVGKKPGILVSGHDLKDLEQLLEQTADKGIDVYTHSEMLPAHYYPLFKKHSHLYGNYGNAWWEQSREFTSFNGPIVMTTNCITPVKKAYQDRIFTSGVVGYNNVKHIPEVDGKKDFSQVIALAQKCPPPSEIETGEIVGGFAHNQVLALADKVVGAVKSGAIKKFVVMAGCDGQQSEREYFTNVAKELPKDTVILTAGCAKYRYNKLDLGDIDGIPRVLDAGQCNDCYSLAVIALKLKEVFKLEDINDLPIEFDIGWYEQKAVAVLLGLLHLGIKGVRLGPTLPAFLSPNVLQVLIENFNVKGTSTASEDIADMMSN